MTSISTTIITMPKSYPTIRLFEKKDYKAVDLDSQTNVLVMGVGDLWTRFIAGGIQNYFADCKQLTTKLPNIRFIAVDVLPTVQGNVRAKQLADSGIPMDENFPYLNLQILPKEMHVKKEGIDISNKNIHSVFISTPPSEHLPGVQVFEMNQRVPIFVEKPLVKADKDQLDEIERLSTNGTIHGTDFFIYSQAFQFLLNNQQYIDQIGTIKEICGRCVEPWKLDRQWLLDKNIAGGGLGIDCVVHPLAMIDVFLRKRFGLGIEHSKIENVYLGRYKDENLQGEDLAETYFNTSAMYHAAGQQIKIKVDGGKGLGEIKGGVEDINYPYYGITIVGEKGSVEVCIGTQYHDPYILIDNKQEREKTMLLFKDGGLGYEGIIGDIHLSMLGIDSGSKSAKRVAETHRAALNSTRFITTAYLKNGVVDNSLIFGGKLETLPTDMQITTTIFKELTATKIPPAAKYSLDSK